MTCSSQSDQIALAPLPIDISIDDDSKQKRLVLEERNAADTLVPAKQGNTSPVAVLAGKYADEPLWSEFLKGIEEYNQEVNLREGKAE